ncbi:MAG: type II 3-dehydroquinate dehydratase [Gammaproteobacteria bacterium]|jgi:3-dehydroquinate dehydratase-2
MSKLLVLHGPNLNLLGTREPAQYGTTSLSDINRKLSELAAQHDFDIDCRQSNAEHDLVGWIQAAVQDGYEFIILNPAAFTHTSVAIRDALSAVALPFIEVHLSNVYSREPFRHHSYVSDIAQGVISGLGANGYEYALLSAIQFLSNRKN